MPCDNVVWISPVELAAPAPSTLTYVTAVLFFSHSLTAYGPNCSLFKVPNFLSKSTKDPKVTGTNAGPWVDVPMIPAGTPSISTVL